MGIRVGVVGAGGKMGTAVCAAVSADPALELVAAVDPFAKGQERSGMTISDSLDALATAGGSPRATVLSLRTSRSVRCS